MRRCGLAVIIVGFVPALMAQTAAVPETEQPGWRKADESKAGEYVVDPGTRVPLSLINSVSTKHSAEGDRVYLESVFPILVNGRVVIPPGSYVAGTLTEVKRPGRVKGRGELYLRFDSLTLPNGVTRDFRARIGGLDGRASEELDRSEGKIRSEGNKGGDARTVGEATAAGASVGVIAGSAAGRHGLGAGIGAAAGATAGLMGVLLTRGPDAVLARGSTIEMVLDRPLHFEEDELDFTRSMQRVPITESGGPLPSRERREVPIPGRRWPY
jgi:type IV secretion system protein VirB10